MSWFLQWPVNDKLQFINMTQMPSILHWLLWGERLFNLLRQIWFKQFVEQFSNTLNFRSMSKSYRVMFELLFSDLFTALPSFQSEMSQLGLMKMPEQKVHVANYLSTWNTRGACLKNKFRLVNLYNIRSFAKGLIACLKSNIFTKQKR